MYSIAGTENENNLKFLMHESTLRAKNIYKQVNRWDKQINNQTDELSDVKYI